VNVLELSGVTVAYGPVVVVDGVDLAVRPGELVALIGPNGAGKSSLLDAVAGVVPTRAGSIALAGHDLARRGPARRHALGLGRTHQTPALLGPTPVDEVALATGAGRGVLAGAVRGLARADQRSARERLDAVGLPTMRHDVSSHGLGLPDQRRVELARALARGPRVLLLDEPASGLPSADRLAFGAVLRSLPAPDRGVLLVEHDMDLVAAVADRVIALDRGRIIASGAFASVAADPRVRESYLGVPA
jgi:branched-chain amino acid transport system ATP-binding protein